MSDEHSYELFYTYRVSGKDKDGLSFQYLVVAKDSSHARTKVRDVRADDITGRMAVVRKSWLYAEEALRGSDLLSALRAGVPVPIGRFVTKTE